MDPTDLIMHDPILSKSLPLSKPFQSRRTFSQRLAFQVQQERKQMARQVSGSDKYFWQLTDRKLKSPNDARKLHASSSKAKTCCQGSQWNSRLRTQQSEPCVEEWHVWTRSDASLRPFCVTGSSRHRPRGSACEACTCSHTSGFLTALQSYS